MADELKRGYLRPRFVEGYDTANDRMSDRISELEAEIERLRASADQLANALRAVQHDRPSAHTDDVWAAINQALITHEEARRG